MHLRGKCLALAFAGLMLASLPATALAAERRADSFPVSIRVDVGQRLGEMKPIWRMFGADEPNYAYMPQGRKLMGELGALAPDNVYFRAHNLLCSGDGTPALKWGSTGVYREVQNGNPIYDWSILDRIFDTYRGSGMHAYAQIGFMPEALSIHPEPYQHSWKPGAKYSEIETGWAYPPKSYEKWRELVTEWVKHCVQRYGKAEVERWYWEVWNEANGAYWKGSAEEFLKLHDYAIDGVRRALPTARVGGPDSAGAGGQWMRHFLEHALRGTNYATGKAGTPLDFVAFHAKGAPSYVDGHVRMGMATQLREIDNGFRLIHSYAELKDVPIVIGECDPEGCAACQGEQLGYRNGTMYSSYTAASFARIWELARVREVNLEAALTWAFTFENQPLFAGFRQVASGGIDLPVLNVFRMFGKMRGQQLAVTSDHAVPLESILKSGIREGPDVSAIAAIDGATVTVLAWHYHDDDLPGAAANVSLEITGLKDGEWKVTRFMIDAEHSNSFTAWQRMGSPGQPTAAQYAELERAGQLSGGPRDMVRSAHSQLAINMPVARQAVVLLVIEPK